MINKNFEKLFQHKKRLPEKEPITQFHMDVAASIQKVTEYIVIKIADHIKEKYKIKNLCLAGGVALNCVANGKILESKIFDNIWVQPAAGDAGGSLGAALELWHNKLGFQRKISPDDKMRNSFLGPKFSNEKIKQELDLLSAIYFQMEEEKILNLVCDEINKGKAIGWFQGRMEFGPRALGARSIIADPRSETMQKILNLKIKYRESFRPFAPSVLEEKLDQYFNLKNKNPYMLFVTKIKDSIKKTPIHNDNNFFGIDRLKIKRSSIPAVTHVDYSARVQSVNKKNNLKFYKLLKKFDEKYDCPLLVNTSFNIRGEPIVCTPSDAYRCFMGCELDMLVIENFILKKKDQDKKNNYQYKDYIKLD